MFFSLMSVSSLSLLQPENLLKILRLKPLFWRLSYSIFWLSWRSFAYDVLWYVLINILSFLSLFFEHRLQIPMSPPPPHRRIRQRGFSPVLLTEVLLATDLCFNASSSMLLSCFLYLWVGRAVVGYLFPHSSKPPPHTHFNKSDNRTALPVSFLSFLTTIWGEGIVFTWFLNLTVMYIFSPRMGIQAPTGVISIQFRRIYWSHGRVEGFAL